MARVEDSSLHNFTTGEVVTESTLDQNFKVLQGAVNNNDKILEDLGINNFAPATFSSLLKTSTTFNQLKFGYVKQITDPLDTRITSLETAQTKPPIIEEVTATTDGQTIFILVNNTYDVGKGEVEVEIDGVPQYSGEGFTETDPKTITLAEGVLTGTVVRVIISQTPVALSEKLLGYDNHFTSVDASLADIATNVNSFNTLQDALNAIGTQAKTLLIQKNITITANTTIPPNVNLWFSPQGVITVNNGVTLTINGGITAGLWQIFAGAGTVVGKNAKITACYPEWFGGKINDQTVDNSPAFDKAQKFFPSVKLSIGDYYLLSLFKNIYSATFEGIGRVTNLGYDLTNIIQLGNFPTIQLDQPMLTLKNLTLKGVTTNPLNDGILFPSLGSYSVFERVYVTGCGGHGIHANNKAATGVDLCEFLNVKCYANQGYGVKIELDPTGGNGFNTSKFELVECSSNQLGGFYFDQCSSLTIERCHAFWNESVNGTTVYGYTIGTNNVSNLKFINSWSESSGEHNYPDPTHKSGGFVVNGGTNLSFDNCHTTNEDRGFIINGGTNIDIINPDIHVQSYASCLDILIMAAANQVVVKDYNMPSGAAVANFSATSYIECTNQLPTSGRIPYNGQFKRGQRGKSFCAAQGTATQYQYNATLSANAGDNFLTWTTNNSLKIGDNILIPGAGASGGGLFALVTDMDMVNKKVYINQTISTSITNQAPATVLAVVYSEDFGTSAPSSGAYQVGDRRWTTNPVASGTMGWVCTTAGSPGTWKTFGTIGA